MNAITARRLLDAYLAGSLSEADRGDFAALLDDPALADWLAAEMKASFADDRYLQEEPVERKDKLNGLIASGIRAAEWVPAVEDVVRVRRAWLRYAAVLLLAAGTVVVVYRTYRQPAADIARVIPATPSADIAAGGNKAVLTLADGKALELLCSVYAEYRDARDVIDRQGATYESHTQNGKIVRARPEVAIASDAWRRIRAMMTEFGLTPSSRSRIAVAPQEKPKNAWQELTG